ncbi:MAG: PilN domain-containing protein [Elainellaceae cyanobacterium]
MYSLDINFLNDRTERPSESDIRTSSTAGGRGDNLPIFVGLAVGAIPLVLVMASWLVLQNLNASARRESAELDAQLATQTSFQAQLASLTAEANQAEEAARALVTVFDRIKPWSALLQSIRDSVPSGVQISSVEQGEGEPPDPPTNTAAATDAAAPAQPEPPPIVINISGFASSFNEVNDFLLVLQRSPFLEAEGTRLLSAQLADYPEQIELPDDAPSGVEVRVPQVVEYNIEAELTDLPASELLPELESTLAVGLTSRIQALRDRGAFEQ